MMTGTLHDNSIIWAIYHLIFLLVLCYLSAVDIRHRRVPNRVLIALIPFGLMSLLLSIHNCTNVWYWVFDRLLAGLLFGGIFASLCMAARTSNSIGGGDIKLIGVMCLVLGLRLTVATVMLALIGALIRWCIIKTRHIQGLHIPFVPYLTCGYVVACLLNF